MLKRSKIRVHPPIADHNENPYIWLPQEYNMKNTDKISFELRYNKSHVHDRKRMYKLSSEIRDLGVKPDPVVNVPVVDMSNQIGTTICVDMINSTAKRFQHKKGRPKRIFSPVSTKATIDENIGVPTNEDAKVEKIINMTEQQLAAMEFKDYFGTRIGRKGQSLQFIYNFDNWVFARVVNTVPDQATGKITYYYNPSEFSALNMVPSIKNIWKQKSIYIPVRFGIDVMPIEQSEALIPANAVDPVGDMRGQENYNNVQDFMRQHPNVAINMPQSQVQLVNKQIINLTVKDMKDFLKRLGSQTIKKNNKKFKASFEDKADEFYDRCTTSNYEEVCKLYNAQSERDRNIIYTASQPQYLRCKEFWNLVEEPHISNADSEKTVQQLSSQSTNSVGTVDNGLSNEVVQQPVEPVEQPVEPVEQPVQQPEQPVEQPAVEQPAPSTVQQQSVIENAMNEQVQQRSCRHAPVTQQSTSVFTDQQPEQQPTNQNPTVPPLDPKTITKASWTGNKFLKWFTEEYRNYNINGLFDTINKTMSKQLRNTLASYNYQSSNNARTDIVRLLSIDNSVEAFEKFITAVVSANVTTDKVVEDLKWFLRTYKYYIENEQ